MSRIMLAGEAEGHHGFAQVWRREIKVVQGRFALGNLEVLGTCRFNAKLPTCLQAISDTAKLETVR